MDKYTVRSVVDGSVDVNASLAAYGNALTKWVSENEVTTESVRDTVDAVFDGQPEGTRLTIPVLVSYVMSVLNPSPAQFSAVEDRIRGFLKGQERFHSSKGKGGGVLRRAREGEPLAVLPAKSA